MRPQSVRPSARSTLERADISLPCPEPRAPDLSCNPRNGRKETEEEAPERTDARARRTWLRADGSATLSRPPVYYLWLGWLESRGIHSYTAQTAARGSLGILPVADLSICRSNDPPLPRPPHLYLYLYRGSFRCYVTPRRRRPRRGDDDIYEDIYGIIERTPSLVRSLCPSQLCRPHRNQ